MLFYEDLEPGAVVRFGHYEVTREEVLDFAGKYDPQPFHLSDEAAALTHFGKVAASGWHTCSMTMAMMVEHHAIMPRAALGAMGVDELRWLRPVYPGDVLSCEMELVEKRLSRSKPGIGILNTKMTTFNQHGQPVLSMKPISLIRVRGDG
ncbi:acyl dehydratase [Erythrobacter sp. SG61-1L]|uniref:MaoC family dehydratase n=1 Tax=Erythrobacter sp. SG61-1L TaxID=1603897 RepID=UPI0006C90CEE|nr:MaoC family dehydratase [Erythrobacter sp. SG61-1L]KPL67675.1 acyl dehydratase [Erythrobacter sp. SG61-1L]